jgi:hypothetical protein
MDSFKLPLEWIDRIFKRLVEAYGSRFASKFTNASYVDLEKTRWQSGLVGVTADEIKNVLNLCNQGMINEPPNVIEFYHYCKGAKLAPTLKKGGYTRDESQQKHGEQYLKLITDKLHGRLDSEGEATLSSLNQQILSKRDDKKSHWQDDKA